jgi:hypothetical protein
MSLPFFLSYSVHHQSDSGIQSSRTNDFPFLGQLNQIIEQTLQGVPRQWRRHLSALSPMAVKLVPHQGKSVRRIQDHLKERGHIPIDPGRGAAEDSPPFFPFALNDLESFPQVGDLILNARGIKSREAALTLFKLKLFEETAKAIAIGQFHLNPEVAPGCLDFPRVARGGFLELVSDAFC